MSGTHSGLFSGLSSYQIPVTDLDALATGQVTARTAERIVSVQRSRRMLMFRAIADADRDADLGEDGPLPPVTVAFRLLARAEQADPDMVAEILGHPAVGVWAVRVLRRLQAQRTTAEAGPPLWYELGYAHSLAGAAALRAGLPVTLRLPARWRAVCLPTVGRAVFPGAREEGYDVAVLEADSHRDGAAATLTLGAESLRLARDFRQPHPTWHPSRRLSWRPGAETHSVLLEDSDPYRDFRALDTSAPPSARAEPDRWQQLLDEAGELLTARHPHAAHMLGFALKTLVPLPEMPRFRIASASYTEAFGSALVSLPHDTVELAVTLVHELRHSLLNALCHQVRLVDRPAGEDDVLLYAPWRTDPRPPMGVLHGAYSFAGVAEFWREERYALSGGRADLAHFEYAVWRDAVAKALESLRVQSTLTVWGRRFVQRLAEQTSPWTREPVPEHPLALARAEAADLWATWRTRHLRPDPAATRRLADQWLNGDAPGEAVAPLSRLRSDPRPGPVEPRGELRRLLLADGEIRPARLRADTAAASADRHPALLTADVDLVSREYARAVRGYRAVIAGDPAAPAAWVGLGLALSPPGKDTAAPALRHRPEAVRAVYLRARARTDRALDPVELSHWIERVPGLIDPR